MSGIEVVWVGAESERGGLAEEVSKAEGSAGKGLEALFRLARQAIVRVESDGADAGKLIAGEITVGEPWSDLDALRRDCEVAHPIELEPGFEGVPSIAAGVWAGAAVFQQPCDDAIVMLRWSVGTIDLPMHVHAHSDRFIVILEGTGVFHKTAEPLDEFTAGAIKSTSVKARDVLVFDRNLLHTFSAPSEDLVVLSYHAPLVDLDDPRQFTLPAVEWRPRALHGNVQKQRVGHAT